MARDLWRGTEAKRDTAPESAVPSFGDIVLTEADIYVGDGVTPLRDLTPADRREILTALQFLVDSLEVAGR